MSKKKLNILWLMSDQHNANCIGAAGHPDVRTPNLDAIAGRGVQFAQAYSNSPICGPSRSSFLSGQYVGTHGISGNFIREVRSEAPNMARCFQQNGYETAIIGKAHLPWQWVEDGFGYVRLSDLCDAAPDDPLSCHYFHDLVQAGLADQYDHGRRLPGEPGYGMKAFVSELPEEYSLEAWAGREAVGFLQQRNRDKPFFMKLSFQRPHDPFSPPANRMDEYDPALLNLPDSAVDYFDRKFSGKPAHQQEYIAGEKGMGYPFRAVDRDELKEQMAAHFTLITMIDDAIGEVIDEIKAQGELDTTVVVYTADHGDFAGEHGMTQKNLGIYESIHRIPLIVAGPDVPEGEVRDMLVESVDLYPTLAALAGVEAEPGIDGSSRIPELNGEGSGTDSVVCEWEFLPPQSVVHAICDERWRLVFYDEKPEDGELYDRINDPGELDNRFVDPGLAEVRGRLLDKLVAFRANARRVHSWQDDHAVIEQFSNEPAIRLHLQGVKWSELVNAPEVELVPA